MRYTKHSQPPQAAEPQQSENARILCIAEVADVLGVCPVTASRIMRESGRAIRLHRRLYVFEDALTDYMRRIENEAM